MSHLVYDDFAPVFSNSWNAVVCISREKVQTSQGSCRGHEFFIIKYNRCRIEAVVGRYSLQVVDVAMAPVCLTPHFAPHKLLVAIFQDRPLQFLLTHSTILLPFRSLLLYAQLLNGSWVTGD